MKKTIAILTVALMILGTMSSALAATYVCTVYGCTKTRNHTHSGQTYTAHHPEDGHYYHQCGLEGCTIADPHNHNDYYDDGYYYGGYSSGSQGSSSWNQSSGRMSSNRSSSGCNPTPLLEHQECIFDQLGPFV